MAMVFQGVAFLKASFEGASINGWFFCAFFSPKLPQAKQAVEGPCSCGFSTPSCIFRGEKKATHIYWGSKKTCIEIDGVWGAGPKVETYLQLFHLKPTYHLVWVIPPKSQQSRLHVEVPGIPINLHLPLLGEGGTTQNISKYRALPKLHRHILLDWAAQCYGLSSHKPPTKRWQKCHVKILEGTMPR